MLNECGKLSSLSIIIAICCFCTHKEQVCKKVNINKVSVVGNGRFLLEVRTTPFNVQIFPITQKSYGMIFLTLSPPIKVFSFDR